MPKFDLMRDKPELDIPTLNYIWDRLWRHNACVNIGRINDDKRSRSAELIATLRILEEMASAEQEAAQ
jgi:hypothetical protein